MRRCIRIRQRFLMIQCILPGGAEPRPYQLRLHFNGFCVKQTVYGLKLMTLPFQGRRGHFVPAGRLLGDPYSGAAKPPGYAIHRGTLPQSARSGCQLPQRGSQGRFAPAGSRSLFPIHSYLLPTPTQVGAAGRVREPTYWYNPRSVTGKRHCR